MRTKMILAFLLVTVIVVITIAGAVSFSAQVIFQQYLEAKHESQLQQWVNFLSHYYIENKSFDDLELITTDSMMRGNLIQGRMVVGGQRGPGQGRDRVLLGETDRIMIVDENRKVIFDSADALEDSILDEREYNKGTPIIVDRNQVGVLVVRDAVTTTVLSLEDEFGKSMNRAISYTSVIALILAAAIGYSLSNSMSRNLILLQEGVRRVSEKNYQGRLDIESRDEIGELARLFNTMVDTIQKNEHIKNSLITDIAHELRTPITTLRGKLEMMQNAKEAVSQRAILILHDEVLRLSRLINDLQDVTQLEDDRLPMNMETVDIHELLSHVTSLFDWELEDKGIRLTIEADATHHYVKADRNRLIQVVINLLTNAIRYVTQEEKQINIITGNSKNHIVISIQDTGKGMSEEEASRVFQRFYRGDESRARASGGSGLGLAITKGIVEAHGGKITVSSKYGVGTTFVIELPL